jgi:aminoglycoside phosphotransferase (APT) family kinase protein
VTGSRLPVGLQLLEDERFVRDRVWPLLSRRGEGGPPSSAFGLRVHLRRGDRRRAVAEYSFEGPTRVVAKLYLDAAKGRAAYRILRSLWKRGFGPRSRYRVPEPIAYLAECEVLLMRAAPGDALGGREPRGSEASMDRMSGAARWLAALHASPLRLGPREDVAQDVLRLARRAAKGAASRPDLEDVFRRSLEELARRCPAAAAPGGQVQTHGRYHAEHVFLAPDCVTVVDLDRAALADPGKDVGEFLHRLRWEAAKAGLGDDALEEPTEAFLDEYARHSRVGLSGLAYHWSYSILWSLLGVACRPRMTRAGRVSSP